MQIDQPRVDNRTKKEATKSKGARFASAIKGSDIEQDLPKVPKNSIRIRREFLEPEWISSRLDDEVLVRVYQSDEELEMNENGKNG